jgi:hypothetical protein
LIVARIYRQKGRGRVNAMKKSMSTTIEIFRREDSERRERERTHVWLHATTNDIQRCWITAT